MKAEVVLGRLIFGGFFLYNGINHFKEYKQLAQYAKSKNVPEPEAAVLASGALLTFGGASILLGAKPKLGSLAILTFLAAVSPVIHDFWNDQDPNQKQNNIGHFMKNLALMGGALAMMGVEDSSSERAESRDGKREKREHERPARLSQRRRLARRAA